MSFALVAAIAIYLASCALSFFIGRDEGLRKLDGRALVYVVREQTESSQDYADGFRDEFDLREFRSIH